jgi:hypothetical protein
MNKTKRGTNERMGGKPQAQENKSKLTQANKTLKMKDGVLTAAIWRCRLKLAKKKGFRDIEASKDAVEVAGRDFMRQAPYTACTLKRIQQNPSLIQQRKSAELGMSVSCSPT